MIQKGEAAENKEKLFGEIDLVCIKDGQFIIGEVKQSVGLFEENDFNKIGDIAEKIKPDVIIFSSLDIDPNALVQKNIYKLQEKLKHLEIEVKWYPIHEQAFKASPVI